MNDKILETPDEAGWFFFQKLKKSATYAVLISEDGVAYALRDDGKFEILDDTVGKWQPIEPELL